MSDELISRNNEILIKVLNGATYEKVGKEFNISKQRVHQIVKKSSNIIFKNHYLTILQYSKLKGITVSQVHYLIKTGGVETKKLGKKNYIRIE